MLVQGVEHGINSFSMRDLWTSKFVSNFKVLVRMLKAVLYAVAVFWYFCKCITQGLLWLLYSQ